MQDSEANAEDAAKALDRLVRALEPWLDCQEMALVLRNRRSPESLLELRRKFGPESPQESILKGGEALASLDLCYALGNATAGIDKLDARSMNTRPGDSAELKKLWRCLYDADMALGDDPREWRLGQV